MGARPLNAVRLPREYQALTALAPEAERPMCEKVMIAARDRACEHQPSVLLAPYVSPRWGWWSRIDHTRINVRAPTLGFDMRQPVS